jgi:hypothetical protein
MEGDNIYAGGCEKVSSENYSLLLMVSISRKYIKTMALKLIYQHFVMYLFSDKDA